MTEKGDHPRPLVPNDVEVGVRLLHPPPLVLAGAAGRLIKRSKRMDYPDWVGSVLRATWVPFALVLAIAIAAGWVLHAYYPEAERIVDLSKR